MDSVTDRERCRNEGMEGWRNGGREREGWRNLREGWRGRDGEGWM